MIPRATYRLQFHKDFTFADAARLADYFAELGVSHIYASPIFTARVGSQHGYDVVDPTRINPELGGEDGFRAMANALKAHDLGVILDIVPNHMAVGQADNSWWLDLLENGRASRSADMFDVDWDTPGLENKVLAPFLDGEPQALWDTGSLALIHDDRLGKPAFAHFGHRFPLRPEDRQSRPVTRWTEAEIILARQHFVLANWREADRRINWRRFFDITDLGGIRIENPAVFNLVHAKPLALYGEGLIDGLRVDHVDGLADPAAYCRHLYQRLSELRPDPYLVVEKIFADQERLPTDWRVHGTTGYDVMNIISALQHADDKGSLEKLWREIGNRDLTFEEEEIAARLGILESKFPAQSGALARALSKTTASVPEEDLRRAIVMLRSYRGYTTGRAGSPGPGEALAKALDQAPALKPLFDDKSADPVICDALRRFHQLSAPVAAKAVEDTAFYRYGRLLSRNDVGFDPRRSFLSPAEFHNRISGLARDFPHSMLTTATHDHKRGEDARARLTVLSARPDLWASWVRLTPGSDPVHPADAYMLYQTLIGAWTNEPNNEFAGRVEGWCRKYLREAKLRSSWQDPNTSYEDHFCQFARSLVLDDHRADFRRHLNTFLEEIRPLAEANMLVQAVLRCTLPGVPDLYQGSEFLDFSMVDPDNRRPVDYAALRKALAAPITADSPLEQRKQAVIARLLAARQKWPDLWHSGSYEPLPAENGLIAFKREYGQLALYVIARCNSRDLPDDVIQSAIAGKDLISLKDISTIHLPVRFLFSQWPAVVILRGGR